MPAIFDGFDCPIKNYYNVLIRHLFNPVKILNGERKVSGELNSRICSIPKKDTENFHGLKFKTLK